GLRPSPRWPGLGSTATTSSPTSLVLPDLSSKEVFHAWCSICSCFQYRRISCRTFLRGRRASAGGRFQYALGTAAPADTRFSPGAGRQDHRCHDHHRDRANPGFWRDLGWLPPVDSDRLRALHRLCCFELLSFLLFFRWRGAGLVS